MQNTVLWEKCLKKLEDEVDQHDFHTWVRPLNTRDTDSSFKLYAPNRFIKDWLTDNLLDQLQATANHVGGMDVQLSVVLDDHRASMAPPPTAPENNGDEPLESNPFGTNVLNSAFTFENHIEGKSNQIARAATKQVSENPGVAYNPLFIYGGVGLGKTHLMHAAGNLIKQKRQNAQVAYVHSERFVSDMVKSIETNTMNKFKSYYRSLDALLIDDIQFFADKDKSQEEFFHTFNTLLETGAQIILTSDKFPKEINNLQERLTSRFESGLTVRIDPPELETRVAILKNKARKNNIDLNDDVAFMVAKKIRSNVRELEGALHRLVASSRFTGREIDLDLAKDTLQDLTLFQERKISIENIQKTVAEFFGIRVSDLKSKRRNRQIARPRQVAMALAKELTNMSLPDIGDAFGGRDHTTVIHACKKVDELVKTDSKINEDYNSLQKILSV
ncbi:chromosomal replication initiator protein DnaA [Arenicella chitinivorans]|uniref:Chromosomal replication initiator protein DnaA n=1 Tax=Arenicella chitinivorans TaxID=1329800 RepID=A0A918RWX4_9GAMM|nr:chromosomal replication initiator protein DnaA [Arenicella chitinivorans]GHA14353.1 chromosomal replication initiator protein DnaA [Arenicella chitinivorans]